ncbi:DNA helicase-2 / ATP-dependent DNA helicase PcrA [Yoonia tamlensis]|uniref:DNA 3'-5' helicase II n=1 Tax=Yoonia tamlensis TaxID=390270 RepID=A0A1I6FZ81_9RHOB|nr:UvrD-helicase domain-containing protein [Yoonia tamlensis]SFR35147.1 DNA helicase-2 / ATP-dependent DNA helicase PcrA [Yoonia tamlensis]
MPELSQEEVTAIIRATKSGSVIAAAGCGKTEQIARTVQAISDDPEVSKRCLILTHTFAGVDVLQKRLRRLNVPAASFRLDTIASWSLRFANGYPKTSGIKNINPQSNKDWSAVYPAAEKLVGSHAIDDVILATYDCVFVDEYQDCSESQHALIVELNRLVPVCVFGDPLQSIFKFDGVVDWYEVVERDFPNIAKLTKPWRWRNDNANAELGDRLVELRAQLEAGEAMDFRVDGNGIQRHWLPDWPVPKSKKVSEVCLDTMALEGTLVVVAQSASEGSRAKIAENLAKQKFAVVEPVSCKALRKHAKSIEEADDEYRLTAVLDFVKQCVVGLRADFAKSVVSHQKGGKSGRPKFGDLIDIGDHVAKPGGLLHVLELVEGILNRDDIFPYRRELLRMMLAALRTSRATGALLSETAGDIEAKSRHLGRHVARRSVGSTLLLKGLEFEHVIIVEYDGMTKEDWYVALTRATRSVTVLSSQSKVSWGDK